MKVKIELVVGECGDCPYMDCDFECGTAYRCRHPRRSAKYGNAIQIKHRNGYDHILKPRSKVEKFCPLGGE